MALIAKIALIYTIPAVMMASEKAYFMTPERYARLKDTLNRRQPDLTVVTDEVHKAHNLSAIIRTCDAFAVPKVHAIWPYDDYRTFRGKAKGSQQWVDVETYRTTEDAISRLQGQGFKVCIANFSERAIDFRAYDFTQPTAIMMGNELTGVTDIAANMADEHLTIPMLGMVQSFNVSVAAALLLSEAERQRSLKGMFDQCRIPDEEYERLLFKWSHPFYARICKEQGWEYPATREDGELADPQGFSVKVNASGQRFR
jgi:tRNA (guanosine-2'-O-)-methyltransferase